MTIEQWKAFKTLVAKKNISLYEDKCLFFLNQYLKVIR